MTNWFRIARPLEEDVEICFDYQADWDLFSDALDGRVQSWGRPRMVSRNINQLLRTNSIPRTICQSIMRYIMY